MSDVTKRMKAKRARREKAHLRARKRVQGTSERPRLSVYKSLRFIYAQVIDDTRGHTLASETDTGLAWAVRFNDGLVGSVFKSDSLVAWCVRGGQGVDPQ